MNNAIAPVSQAIRKSFMWTNNRHLGQMTATTVLDGTWDSGSVPVIPGSP
jgi:hypothetical protein